MKKVLLALLFILLFLNAYIRSEDDCTRRFNSYLKNSCESHSINITHSCSYSNGQCKFKFNTCSSYSGSDKTTCESIFPSGSLQYCKVINRKCTLFNKNCDEYDPEGKYTCSEYTAGESQSCRLINDKCQAHYDKCEDFTSGVNEEKCKANIPLISTNNVFGIVIITHVKKLKKNAMIILRFPIQNVKPYQQLMKIKYVLLPLKELVV